MNSKVLWGSILGIIVVIGIIAICIINKSGTEIKTSQKTSPHEITTDTAKSNVPSSGEIGGGGTR